jgi:hypothetical protein
MSLLRSGSAASRATGAWAPHNIALLAAGCDIAGQVEEALTLLEDALRIVETTGERWSQQKGMCVEYLAREETGAANHGG